MNTWKKYYTPSTIEEALALLQNLGPHARIIAGGTDLFIEMRNGRQSPEALIDITRIPNLDEINYDGDGKVRLGPTVTHNQAAGSEFLKERVFPLVQACWNIGSPMVRNRGTIAGNIITASPANDSIPPLLALDAVIELSSASRGFRTVPLSKFIDGVRKTVMFPDEMLTGISFKPLKPTERGVFIKLGLRKAVAISLVNAAVIIEFDGSKIKNARLAAGSVAPVVIRNPEAETYLVGKVLNDEIIKNASLLSAETAVPIDDVRSSAAYRKRMVSVVIERALNVLCSGTEREGLPISPPMLWGKTDGHFPKLLHPGLCHTLDNEKPIETVVNGRHFLVRDANDKTLLAMLREDLGLIGSKEGCSVGDCGSCTVWLDGIAVLGCLTPAVRAHGAEIVTIEGVNGRDGVSLSILQQELIGKGAVQCGYCTPGIVMAGESLLAEREFITEEVVRNALAGNLCRCTGYYKIIQAVESAAAMNGSSYRD
jgi:xanthine dehydrogenase iron-sulfur cluster and FAD-binding subunit A